MRYQEVRRPGYLESLLLRLKITILRSRASRPPAAPVCGIDDLTPHQLRDIGLQGFERGFDWWRFR